MKTIEENLYVDIGTYLKGNNKQAFVYIQFLGRYDKACIHTLTLLLASEYNMDNNFLTTLRQHKMTSDKPEFI